MGRKFEDEAPIPRSKPVKEWDDIEDEEILYITKFEAIDEGDVLHCISGNEEYEVLGHPKALCRVIRRKLGLHAVYHTEDYGVKIIKRDTEAVLGFRDGSVWVVEINNSENYKTPGIDYDYMSSRYL